MKTTYLIAAMLGLSCIFGCINSSQPTTANEVGETNVENATTETAVIAKLIDGSEWKAELATRTGKVIVVDLWASW